MQIVIFCHSLVSDWNHGNVHFLRGIASELLARGHQLRVLEPACGWSRRNLVARHGSEPVCDFVRAFPQLHSATYEAGTIDLDRTLDGVGLVLVHEWNDPNLVRRIGAHRARSRGYRLLFHDTHHRAVTRPWEIARLDLDAYDGVLAFGEVIRRLYLERGWTRQAWTWHEAADTRVFSPRPMAQRERDLVWVGNWGDDERTRELREFLLAPARRLRLTGTIHGVRYPRGARMRIALTRLSYRGWIANHHTPEAFARHRLTVHIPRRPYADLLPGIPTIRPFEALACGIPLICAPWEDVEGLFRAGTDYLIARDGAEMRRLMREVLHDQALAESLSRNGPEVIRARHTCAHRADELLAIHHELMGGSATADPGSRAASACIT
jgi:spore maturation protein CgeB